MGINIRASYDSFRELRESAAYYVDKTEVIEEYLVRRFDKAVMFARPRRFGKTLTMTMLRDFLDIRQDSRDIFAGLKIMEYPDVIRDYMNQYPVVFLSLKEVFGDSFKMVYNNLRLIVANYCKCIADVAMNPDQNEADRSIFKALEFQNADEVNSVAALDILSRMLKVHYGKPVFVIIDEYDVPMAKALGTPYYDKVRDMIEHMLSYVCKTNSNVKGVILSGCLYTVKNSTYTGVNNIIPYTVLSPIYASSVGFTDEDVKQLLEDAGLSHQYDAVAEWYDGYMFGREKLYCPWDVLSYVKSVLDGSYDEDRGPESYWLNTSETSLNLIHGFLGKSIGANEKFEQLLAGETIDCTINEFVPYHRIHENGENLWSALVETGYLTKAVPGRPPLMPLRIPNRSIQNVFRQEVWNYFNDKVDNTFVQDLVNTLWAGEIEKAEASLDQILEATLSFYHEYHEYSYHLILDGFFTGLGYRVQSERETGYGRSDLIILDPARQRCQILELKHVKMKEDIEPALNEASSQMIQKKYGSQLRYEGYTTRLQYGMAFYDKQARIVNITEK
ncbi:MAG: AAA family ATPase [Clostridia bacterium]|nr:AAA family ATPase [Clostridia bacterium]